MGFYYGVLYAADWFTIALPFIISSGLFYLYYSFKYKRLSTRVRTKTMINSYVTPQQLKPLNFSPIVSMMGKLELWMNSYNRPIHCHPMPLYFGASPIQY